MVNGSDLRNRYRRAYGRRVVSTVPPPLAPLATSPHPPANGMPTPKVPRRRTYVYLFTVVLVVAIGIVGGWVYSDKKADPIPDSIKEKTSLTLYYPSWLPEGYALEKESFKIDGYLITFNATNPEGDKIPFTLQARPQTFDFQAFYTSGLSQTEQFVTPLGQAAVGKSPAQQLVGNLVSDRTWIIVSSSTPDVTVSDFRMILNGLKKSS